MLGAVALGGFGFGAWMQVAVFPGSAGWRRDGGLPGDWVIAVSAAKVVTGRRWPARADTRSALTRVGAGGVMMGVRIHRTRARYGARCNRQWRRAVSVGEGLAEARRRAGLTVAQVSQRTRIRETIICGIERDDYGGCGGDFYTRGHIRAIARAVGADPGPLIAEYDAAHPAPQVTAADLFPPVRPVKIHQRRRVSWAAVLGLALVAALGLSAYHVLTGSPHSPGCPGRGRVAPAPAPPPPPRPAAPGSPPLRPQGRHSPDGHRRLLGGVHHPGRRVPVPGLCRRRHVEAVGVPACRGYAAG